ncbi:threonine aldolase family protein [Salipiger profundus]|uniref:threonine aldolase family protein n=1 Tax=Salipiger profundus TaxID=1229727 RepID=UPI000B8195EF|nr:GntG family PLP-dependent aldolase [Salipiger profundus]
MIDLSSDTCTTPTPAMRQAMASAVVGDEQSGSDPTTSRLCARLAEMLGQEDAVLLPSGTMCNLVAAAVHLRPGDEIICARSAHIYGSEGAGTAVLTGASIAPIESADGTFGIEDVKSMLRPDRARAPSSRLVCVEQTVNRSGGTVWSAGALDKLVGFARSTGLNTHMDGARLFNASVATKTSAETYSKQFNSVWVDLSKGLGCPVGGVLLGSRDFIAQAWIWKHRLGGAMRQSGVLAAAGLYALDNHIERLTEDHDNAALLAHDLSSIEFLKVLNPNPQTNIVLFELSDREATAEQLRGACRARGVQFSIEGTHRLRAVTHLGISEADIRTVVQKVRMASLGR